MSPRTQALCRALAPALYIDLADQREFLSFAKDPDRLRREVAALALPALGVMDEIQRVSVSAENSSTR